MQLLLGRSADALLYGSFLSPRRLPRRRWLPVLFSASAVRAVPLLRPPHRSRRPPRDRCAVLGRAAPSRAAACAATPRRYGSFPDPRCFAVPVRSPRFSGWSPTTWSETRCAAAGACPGKSCPPSPKPDNRIAHTAAGPRRLGRALRPSTAGTHKTLWPAQLHQILATRLLSGKTPLKLLQRPRVVLHSPACYMLGSRESSAYPELAIVYGSAIREPFRRKRTSGGGRNGRTRSCFHPYGCAAGS